LSTGNGVDSGFAIKLFCIGVPDDGVVAPLPKVLTARMICQQWHDMYPFRAVQSMHPEKTLPLYHVK